jgi:glycosyl transferase family 25
MFDRFDAIRIVNLPHRKDRLREMTGELKKVGLAGHPKVEFFPAHRYTEAGRFYSPGARGCFSSHLAILREAAANGRSVLILEDDCNFVDPSSCRIPVECDVFYGGYLASSLPDDLANSDIVGSHCMGFSVRGVSRVLPWIEAAWESDDPAPIDGEYVRFRRANPDIVTMFAEPQVAVQRPSRTDVGPQRLFDRLPGLREVAGLARKARRALASGLNPDRG